MGKISIIGNTSDITGTTNTAQKMKFPADLVTFTEEILKGTVMQIKKALINDRLRVSKTS